MTLRSRIEHLEKVRGIGDWDITCKMPNGAQHKIALRGRNAFFRLFSKILREEQTEEAELLRRAVSVVGPDDSYLGEMLQAFVLSPRGAEPLESKTICQPTPEPAKEVSLAPVLVMPSEKPNEEVVQ